MSPKRVLFVSYPFPPVGGAGVQRTTKFVKYLNEYGWQPSVLTAANPSVPAFDDSLVADIPGHTLVRRAKTWEPGYALKAAVSAGSAAPRRYGPLGWAKGFVRRAGNLLLQPDAQILWMPQAVREGSRLLQEVPHDTIVATGPPFSSFLIGAALSRRSGLPLVLDYRDEWSLSSTYWENKRQGPMARCIQAHMQRVAIRVAKALVATTRSSAGALQALRDAAGARARVDWIYNGFDPDDFGEPQPRLPDSQGCYQLVYTGTLWELTSVAPLAEAVARLEAVAPDLTQRLEVVFAGRRTSAQQKLVDQLKETSCRVVEYPYLPHEKALDLVQSADGLCALLSDLPGAGRVVPAKIFEYIAAKRPVLAIAPRGELWDILDGYALGRRYLPGDVEGITGWLAKEIRGTGSGMASRSPRWNGSPFDRRHQAGQLAALLDSLCDGAGRHGRS